MSSNIECEIWNGILKIQVDNEQSEAQRGKTRQNEAEAFFAEI